MLVERTNDASLLLVLLHGCACLSLLFTSAAECCAGIVDAPDIAASIVQLQRAAHEGTAAASSVVLAAHARCRKGIDTELLVLALLDAIDDAVTATVWTVAPAC
jgi:hypothetical protein